MSQPTARPKDPTADAVAALLARIRAAATAAQRPGDAVRLLAVTKTVPADALHAAVAAGVTEFGESYLQEALPKIAALGRDGLTWHFIGPLQSNKTREIAANFDWVHGIDRLRIAQRLSDQRDPALSPLQVCVQVNISGESSKSGCEPAEAPALCAAVAALPRLRLRGLMAIPAPLDDGVGARAPYATLRTLFERIRATLPTPGQTDFDTISAGMSDDLEAAIAEGSTIVRVGSALFGERPAKN